MARTERSRSIGAAAFAATCLVAFLATGLGAQEGPYLVKDLNAFGRGSSPIAHIVFQGEVYFTIITDERGRELWRTDGTVEGTVSVRSFGLDARSSPSSFFAAGDVLYFAADDGESGLELWRTDGTTEGTTLVRDLFPGLDFAGEPEGSRPSTFFELGGRTYFTARLDDFGREFWVTDGTFDGTHPVADLHPGPGNGAFSAQPTRAGEAVFVYANCGAVDEDVHLCRAEDSDPRFVPLSPPLRVTREMEPFLDGVAFPADDGSGFGTELWYSDGTPEGTSMIADIDVGLGSGAPAELTAVNGWLVFAAHPEGGIGELWRSDGTEAGTGPVGGGCVDCSRVRELVAAGDRAYFAAEDDLAGEELWRTDGTGAGTVRVADVRPGLLRSNPRGLTVDSSGLLFFTADDGVVGNELWSSDGTEAGTQLVADIAPEGDAHPASLVAVPDRGVVFTASQPQAGRELWFARGPEEARVVSDLNPWTLSSDLDQLTKVGGRLFFRAEREEGDELWSSDGTESGTVRLEAGGEYEDSLRELVEVDGEAYFPFDFAGIGRELVLSDGTPEGTRVFDLCPGDCSSSPGVVTPAASFLYLSAFEEGFGEELWRFDGTREGSVRITDLCEGECSADIVDIETLGDGAFFTASGVLDGRDVGREIFFTDGTAEGTLLVRDLEPGSGSSSPRFLTRVAEDAIVFAANVDPGFRTKLWRTAVEGSSMVRIDAYDDSSLWQIERVGDLVFVRGTRLWTTDGTEAGTVQLGNASVIGPFVAVGDRVYFKSAEGGFGFELWTSDGTVEGTRIVRDIAPGAAWSDPQQLTAFGESLFFTAELDDGRGRELWRTDGSEEGTQPVADIDPQESSSPDDLTSVGDTLFFTAYSRSTGRELWAYVPPQEGESP